MSLALLTSDIKLVSLYSTIKMMDGPRNIRKLYMFGAVPLYIIRSVALYTQQYIQVC